MQEEWKKFWRNNSNFFSNLMKTIILQIKEGQRTPSITNVKKKKKTQQVTLQWNCWKWEKWNYSLSNKDKILKVVTGGKNHITDRGTKLQMAADFSSETTQARKQRSIFEVLKGKKTLSALTYTLNKNSFKRRKTCIFADKEDMYFCRQTKAERIYPAELHCKKWQKKFFSQEKNDTRWQCESTQRNVKKRKWQIFGSI